MVLIHKQECFVLYKTQTTSINKRSLIARSGGVQCKEMWAGKTPSFLSLLSALFFSRSLTRWAAPYYLNPWNRLEVWRRYGCICCCHSVILGSIQSQPHVHHSHKINVNKSVTEVSFDKLSWPLVSFAAVLCVFMQCCNFGALHDNTKNGFTGDYR